MYAWILYWCWCLTWVAGSVLDPAPYLAPGPPLLPVSGELSPAERWAQRILRPEREANDDNVDADLLVVPLDKTIDPKTSVDKDTMEKSETVWLGFNTRNYGLYGVPSSFNPTGVYGMGSRPYGTVASSYANVGLFSDDRNAAYGKYSLAGSGYGSYGIGNGGTRLYGNTAGPSWGGWGNGKWGHYGKG